MTQGPSGGPEVWEVPLKPPRGDVERLGDGLGRWLAARPAGRGRPEISDVRSPAGSGVSNETVLFRATWGDGDERLVARIQTADPLYFDPSVERQFSVYRALGQDPAVPVPEVIAYEPDPSFVGAPFFVMRQVEGLVPPGRPHFTTTGWVYDASPTERRRLWETAVARLVDLHRTDTARLGFLARPDCGDSALEQDLGYWHRFYRWAAQSQSHPVIELAMRYLADHLPADPVAGLSWGDARIENMVFDDFCCVAILDFESASLAGPICDLAWWSLMDKGSSYLDGLGSPKETIERYVALGGPEPRHLHWYLVLCAFKLATVYVRLATQLEARGELAEQDRDLGRNSEKMQQLALLLDVDPPGPLSASLPDLGGIAGPRT